MIFWFSKIYQEINELINPEITYKKYLELSAELSKVDEIGHIINYINEKKFDHENNNLNKEQINIVKNMIRAEFLSKFMNENFNFEKLNNIIEDNNNNYKKNDIREDEYFYFEGISAKYSPNLKVKIPIFEPKDIFHLFFKYSNNDKYKLGEVLDEKTTTIGNISDNAIKLLYKDYKNARDMANEIGCFLYSEITKEDVGETKEILDIIQKKIKSSNLNEKKKKELQRISDYIKYIHKLNENIINLKSNNFILDDFNNLLNEQKQLMDVNSILKKAKENSYIFNPSFIYYIHNNSNFIDKLFNLLNSSNESIIYDLSKGKNIDYIPFWLFMLRNLSSLNNIDIDISDKNLKRNKIEKIKKLIIENKEKIKKYLFNR